MYDLSADNPITTDEITQEFLDDLSTEMIVDEIEARKQRCTEDGLGKMFVCLYD